MTYSYSDAARRHWPFVSEMPEPVWTTIVLEAEDTIGPEQVAESVRQHKNAELAERNMLRENAIVLRTMGGVTDSPKMLARFPRTIWARPWSPQDYGDYCDSEGRYA